MTTKRVVTIHYTLKDKEGNTIDSSVGADPLVYLEGTDSIIPGLERQVSLLSVGNKKQITVLAKDGYGEKNQELVVKVPRTNFPEDIQIKIGDKFHAGSGHNSQVFEVLHVENEEVTLDGNHPLAGQDLSFDVEVVSIRDATKEEVAHGHAHGAGGHHH